MLGVTQLLSASFEFSLYTGLQVLADLD